MTVPVEILDARYILWENYGAEGWRPTPFNSLSDLRDHIQEGSTHSGFVITENMDLRVAKRGA